MAPASSSRQSGFTLIEVMVSIVILSIGLLGLLQAVNMSIEHNMRNQLRNEGASLADAELSKDLSQGWANVTPPAGAAPVTTSYSKTRLIMNAIQKSYSVTRTGTNVNSASNSSKMVNFVVSWRYKQVRYNLSATSLIAAPRQ